MLFLSHLFNGQHFPSLLATISILWLADMVHFWPTGRSAMFKCFFYFFIFIFLCQYFWLASTESPRADTELMAVKCEEDFFLFLLSQKDTSMKQLTICFGSNIYSEPFRRKFRKKNCCQDALFYILLRVLPPTLQYGLCQISPIIAQSQCFYFLCPFTICWASLERPERLQWFIPARSQLEMPWMWIHIQGGWKRERRDEGLHPLWGQSPNILIDVCLNNSFPTDCHSSERWFCQQGLHSDWIILFNGCIQSSHSHNSLSHTHTLKHSHTGSHLQTFNTTRGLPWLMVSQSVGLGLMVSLVGKDGVGHATHALCSSVWPLG